MLKLLLASALAAGIASAQSPLTTTFANNNSGAVGGGVYFDVTVPLPGGIVVNGLAVNLGSVAATAGTIEVYTCPTTRVGNQTNVAAWTLVSSGAVTAAGPGLQSAVAVTPFTLLPGSYGMALKAVGVNHAYTNGNGSNQNYSTAELSLSAGEASNVAFAGSLFTPRVVNCAISYVRPSLTTLFANNNNGAVGGGVYFDVNVTNAAGITLTELDVNLISAAATAGTIEVYTCSGTRTGNQTTPAVWSLVGSGAVTSAGPGLPSSVAISPIPLSFGTVGMAFRAVGVAHAYTNGNGANQTYSNSDLTVLCGEASNVAFAAPLFTPRVANCRFGYMAGLVGMQATVSNYGTGCQSQVASFYESMNSGAFDLSNSSMTLTRTNPGYSVGTGGTYVAPSGGAVVLGLGDDTTVATPVLSTPFPYDGGTAATLQVCSNGFISVASGNGNSWTPTAAAMLNAPQTAWWCWHDYNPAIVTPGAGRVMFQEIGNVAYITWDGVWNYQGANASAANTFQFQFNLVTGAVTLVWAQMSALGSGWVVGYSPGGPSADPTNRDLSATLGAGFFVNGSDQALTLNVAQRPIPFNTISMVTGNNNPSTIFGAVILGLTSFPGGISLAPQMPGCFQYNNAISTSPLFFGGAATQVTSFGIPPAVGLHIFVQSAIYCPGANLTPLGAVSSNGVDLRIGSY